MAELKFKAGQKVKVVSNSDPCIKSKQLMVGKVCEIKFIDNSDIYPYSVWNEDKSNWWWFIESDLQAVERTLDDLEVGDILVNGDEERKVLGLLESLIFTSDNIDFDSASSTVWTVKQLKIHGWSLKQEEQPEDTTEISIQEIADKFNIDVDKLRIKE